MYNILIYDSADNVREYQDIVKVAYINNGKCELTGEAIFTGCYPFDRPLYLYSEKVAYIIKPDAISKIQVEKTD